jgi:hypothetical protein
MSRNMERIFEEVLSESEKLQEMSKLISHETGLPMTIWVDEGRTFIKGGHGNRLKFQDGPDTSSRSWPTMSINDDPQPMDKHNLSNKDIKKLQLFITKNLTALNRLGDDDFGIIAFAKTMIKI